ARARIVHGPEGFGKGVSGLTVNGCCRKVVATPPRTARMRLFRLFLPAFLLLSLPACASDPWVELGGERYSVEVADDDAERARGLMFRDRLEPGHGMLFIHERESTRLNSSHVKISYAVFCLKKKNNETVWE